MRCFYIKYIAPELKRKQSMMKAPKKSGSTKRRNSSTGLDDPDQAPQGVQRRQSRGSFHQLETFKDAEEQKQSGPKLTSLSAAATLASELEADPAH